MSALTRHGRPRRRNERGVVLVLVALMLTALMVIAALVVDLGFARSNAVASQSDADLAALAGGRSLGNNQPRVACEEAVRNAATNLPELASVSPTSFCAVVPATACSGGSGTKVSPSATVGRATIQVTYPVPDADITDSDAPGPWENDGTPCERMRVSISIDASTTFARILGVDNLEVTRSATVRGTVTPGENVPALWLLDPTGCVPLGVTGGSKVTVGIDGATPIAGLIAVDSDGSTCNSNQTTVSASGSGTELKAVPTSGDTLGKIMLHAMRAGATACEPVACNPAHVSSGSLSPLPVRANSRATRAPVDWRYDCKPSYPNYMGIAIAGCTADTPSYLSNLRTAIGTTGQPAGFNRWSSAHSCNPSGTITVSGNWWVDCGGQGLRISNGNAVHFRGGNVVFDRGMSMTGGAISFNTDNPTASLPASCVAPAVSTPCTTTSSAEAGWIYVRNGDWSITGGNLTVNRSAVIMNNGSLSVNAAPPSWTAPTQGPFAGLSYWSELVSNKFSMAGGAGVTLSGVFFTPGAEFSLSGGGNWGQQSAQFITYQLSVSGGGNLTLSPDDTLVGLVSAAGMLIR